MYCSHVFPQDPHRVGLGNIGLCSGAYWSQALSTCRSSFLNQKQNQTFKTNTIEKISSIAKDINSDYAQ